MAVSLHDFVKQFAVRPSKKKHVYTSGYIYMLSENELCTTTSGCVSSFQ